MPESALVVRAELHGAHVGRCIESSAGQLVKMESAENAERWEEHESIHG
jgi:hypothetical protein